MNPFFLHTSKWALVCLLLASCQSISAQIIDSVCYGFAPGLFNSTALPSGSIESVYIYEWQDSVAGGTWNSAAGVNADTSYQAQSLTETTYYRRRVEVLQCGEEAFSNVLAVVVLDSVDASFTSVLSSVCSNAADGSAVLSASGGVGDFSYSWSNGQSDSLAQSLSPGTYTVTITDAFGCSTVRSTTIGFDHTAPVFSFVEDTVFLSGENALLASGVSFPGYLWSDGSSDSTTSISSSGWYSLTVTDSNGCTAIDSLFVELTTGIRLTERDLEVKVYPNPSRDYVNVFIGNAEVPESIEMRTHGGRVIQQLKNTSSIDINGVAAGVYLLRIQHEGSSFYEQIIVQ